MRDVEARIFAAGMPVAALMEKVGGLIARRVQSLYPNSQTQCVGILVGPGHNGGDALIVARELHFQGYQVVVYCPFSKLKELTSQHAQYAQSLGIEWFDSFDALQECDLLIDGLFGFGLERLITDPVATAINQINQWTKPIVSIDLPSGLHTNTGEVMGTAIRATRTFCLGLWKLGLLQDQALDYVGTAELIDFDIRLADMQAVLGDSPRIQRIARASVAIPLPRPPVTHKYKQGHLLLICGSRRYAGGAILTGLGARASGVGMLSIAVPESLKPLLVAQMPEALIVGCPETQNGAIAQLQLPEGTDLNSFDGIACGPGLTLEAMAILAEVLASDRPLVLDADGLNILAQLGTIPTLSKRQAATILTPHTGEFKRLFPEAGDPMKDRVSAVRSAAESSGAVVLLKGARTAIANSSGSVWINPESTPALARGGSGDVLTGLLGGLIAQASLHHTSLEATVATAAWWHSQAGILAALERTELGVDAFTLTQYLIPVLR
ncbi:MAG: NAD(P)H-hydrate dehydratase [Gloeocapsa sp. UFS-A4-WI-NPMV-4B04]|nr:NAD(P)H-hydrate dehydratase [Gloeocapsa sp. UFS-A4-WI-NPMV-4B04]